MSVVEELRKRARTLIMERPVLREAYYTVQRVTAQGPILRRLRDVVGRVRERLRERIGR